MNARMLSSAVYAGPTSAVESALVASWEQASNCQQVADTMWMQLQLPGAAMPSGVSSWTLNCLQVIGVPEIGVNDSFLELGGTSIMAARLAYLAQELTGTHRRAQL